MITVCESDVIAPTNVKVLYLGRSPKGVFAVLEDAYGNRFTYGHLRGLVRHFGPERALDVIWWACRCHYMTRVADAFQLPLERENAFAPPPKESKKP